jgi:non-ribosomal peptide synthetase-like protein
MVSDGLSMMNTASSSSSFKVGEVCIGHQNYLGNNIHYPSGGRTGENCLIGTKTMIPVDGPVRENVGLLGSPAFEIPRMVDRDRDMSASFDEATKAERLKRKNVHNFATVLLYLLAYWIMGLVALVGTYQAIAWYPAMGIWSVMVVGMAIGAFAIPYFAFIERASLGFKRLQPRTVPVLDPYFWDHERHWKLAEHPLMSMFAGTPMRSVIGRMLGMKIGRKVFDDGAQYVERTLIEIGDYANLNFAATLQGHSLEEGVFKSDRIVIGAGATVGVGAFVHYGATMGEGSVLEADAFLMKGETMDARAVWHGNPARAVTRASVVEPAAIIEQPAEIAA